MAWDFPRPFFIQKILIPNNIEIGLFLLCQYFGIQQKKKFNEKSR